MNVRIGRGVGFRCAGLAVVLAVATVMTTSGCGLGANDEPQPLDRENVPPAARDDTITRAPTATDGQGVEITVWFVQTDESGTPRLVAQGREVPEPGGAEARLQALISQPPNDAEQADGISTFVPEDTGIPSPPVHTEDRVLVVNLSENFYDLQGDSSRNAFAQVVYTATEVPGVDAVRFEEDGRATDALDGDGQAVSGPVGRDAYRNLTSDGGQ